MLCFFMIFMIKYYLQLLLFYLYQSFYYSVSKGLILTYTNFLGRFFFPGCTTHLPFTTTTLKTDEQHSDYR